MDMGHTIIDDHLNASILLGGIKIHLTALIDIKLSQNVYLLAKFFHFQLGFTIFLLIGYDKL